MGFYPFFNLKKILLQSRRFFLEIEILSFCHIREVMTKSLDNIIDILYIS